LNPRKQGGEKSGQYLKSETESMNDMPTISVILSAYNSQKTISEAIESILQQTVEDFELILIDDGSTDTTSSILQEFASKDDRIKIITNEKNIGLTRSLNKGLQIARGEFIARMDADDISLPDRFEKQIRFFNEHPEINLLGGRYTIINEHGETIGESDSIYQTDFLIRWRMLYFNAFIHSTVMFRSQCLEHVSGYNESLQYAQDFDLWVRIMQHGKAANLPDILIKQRRMDRMISIQHKDEQNQIAVNIARNNINHIDDHITFSTEEFSKLQIYYYTGITPPKNKNEIKLINNWIKVFQTFSSSSMGNKRETAELKEWFTDKLLRYPGNLIRIPVLFKFTPYKSMLLLTTSVFRKILGLPKSVPNKFNELQIIPKVIGLWVKLCNAINKVQKKPKIFLYTDSRGQKIENKYLKHQGVFPLYALPLLTHYQIEYHTCEETHTTFLDFLRVYEASKKDYDIVIAHIGIVDFSPRPASGVQAIYELKKEWFDKIFGVSNMESHILNPMETTYEGECTNNLYSLQMAEKHLIPVLKAIPNLIWISSNHFVPGWRGNYFKERPSNIAITEDYAQRFAELLPNVINLLNWQIDDIKTYTCDNIHLSKAGFKQISIQLLSEIRKVLENKSSQ
jgi:glycosyltransferase involved in cell wall biosynthesis